MRLRLGNSTLVSKHPVVGKPELFNRSPSQIVALQNLDLGSQEILVGLQLLVAIIEHLRLRSVRFNFNARSGFVNRLHL